MDTAKDAIAGINRVDDDSKGVDIHDFRKRFTLFLHFLINAEKMFLSPNDGGFVPFSAKCGFDLLADIFDQFFAITASLGSRCCNTSVAHRIQGSKPEVFKFHSHGVHAEPHRDRGIYLERFFGDPSALNRAKHTQGTHVM